MDFGVTFLFFREEKPATEMGFRRQAFLQTRFCGCFLQHFEKC